MGSTNVRIFRQIVEYSDLPFGPPFRYFYTLDFEIQKGFYDTLFEAYREALFNGLPRAQQRNEIHPDV